MKFSKLPRIYVKHSLTEDSHIYLYDKQAHYITAVLRLKINSQFRVFNESDGEFIAQIRENAKNHLLINIKQRFRVPNTEEAQLTLSLAIIKPEKFLVAVNMATQLGVTTIIPLITERCQLKTINYERLLRCTTEATEQSERLNLPIVMPIILLTDYLANNTHNFLIYANEQEKRHNTMIDACQCIDPSLFRNPVFIVGPEGGFTDNELREFSEYQNVKSVSLGHNILRTETAVAAGLAQLIMMLQNYPK